MASNHTHAIWEILKPVDFEELILAFCLSILMGLLMGVLVLLLLTWASRRRASVKITRRPDELPRASRSQCRLSHYRSHGFDRNPEGTSRAALNLHRQTSLDPNELLGRSHSFQNSTFRPPKKVQSSEEPEDDDALVPSITDPFCPAPAESFWLGKGSLRGFLPTQTPPPAYESVIRMFQHT